MPFLGFSAAVLAALSALFILVSRNFRLTFVFLGVQYLSAFFLLTMQWPFLFALSILTAGWISLAVLGMTMVNRAGKPNSFEIPVLATSEPPAFLLFLISIIITLVVSSFAPLIAEMIPNLEPVQSWTALFLIGIGLIRLSTRSKSIEVLFTLLMILLGFVIFFSGLMLNPVVITLLVSIHFLIALTGSFLVYSTNSEGLA